MPRDDINYRFTENGVVYDFYDVFVPAEYFRQPALWVWGRNSNGQLGTNTRDGFGKQVPVTTILGGTNWKQVSSGGYNTAAIKTDGSLWISGFNGLGQLGVNDTTSRSTPVTTILGGNDWKSVSLSDLFNIAAIKSDGSLWTWGSNSQGVLGVNDITQRLTPVTTILGGNDWKQVSTRNSFIAAIKTDGTLWTWGINNSGQLGVNNTTSRSTPVTTILGGNDWKQVSCGYRHTAAIKTDGSLWTWGLNNRGQLGVNDRTQRRSPVTTILGGNNWKQVSSGGYKKAAIKTDGTLWTWGSNVYGSLGVNDTTSRSTPVTTIFGGTNWKSVSCGVSPSYDFTTTIKTDGTLWLWGNNDAFSGQLGVNDTTSRSTPVTTIRGGNNWKLVSAGGRQVGAIQYTPDP